MIVYLNVCDHCGTQKTILPEKNDGISVTFTIDPVHEAVENTFKFKKKDFQGTFCDRECFISWLKENLNQNGLMKKKEEE